MDTTPSQGDFVIEPSSKYFVVRREGVTKLLCRHFVTYGDAVSFALQSAYSREVHAFIKSPEGWVCLD